MFERLKDNRRQIEKEEESMGVPQRRTQQQRREETRAKLIDAAFELIRDKGASSFTTAEVANVAGLTRGAIQYHYSDPYELLREVVLKVVRDMATQIDAPDLLQYERMIRLEKVVEIYWQGYRSDTYAVFMELAVHGRLNPNLSGAIKDALSILETERDEQWLILLADFEGTNAEKVSWRSSLLVILRGMALKQMFADTERDVERIFKVVKDNYIRSVCIEAGLITVNDVLN